MGPISHAKSLSLNIFIKNLLPVSNPQYGFLGDTGFIGQTEYSSAQIKGFEYLLKSTGSISAQTGTFRLNRHFGDILNSKLGFISSLVLLG